MLLLQMVLLGAALQPAAQVQPGSLAGTVTRMDATRAPIGGVLIRAGLMSGGPRDGFTLETVTDGAGNYSFRNLAPGRYVIQASAEGYGFRSSLFSALGPRAVQITVEAGKQIQVPPMSLMLAATIGGRLLDKDERPMPGVQIEFLRLTSDEQGRRVWSIIPAGTGPSTQRALSTTRTDDNGEFRHPLLGPGDYYLRATLSPTQSLPLSVYYPSTTEASTAGPIRVSEGDNIVADIHVGTALEAPSYRVSGTIVHPAIERDNLIAGLTLVQRQPSNTVASPSVASISTIAEDSTGRFELLDIRQGSYDLIATVVIDGRPHASTMPIEVRDQDVENVALSLRPEVEVKGKLVATGEARDIQLARRSTTSPLGNIGITLRRKDGLFKEIPANPVIDESGTAFSFPDIPEGNYEIVPTIVSDARATRSDLYIADIRAGGRSVFDNGFSVGADAVDAMEVIVGTGAGSIEGQVQGPSALPAALILVPDATRRNNASLYRITYLPRNASFTLNGLAPGTYKIFAVPYLNETVPYRGPEFLAQHEANAVSVTVPRGATVNRVRVPFLSLGAR